MKKWCVYCALLMALLLCGCQFRSASELYCLPRQQHALDSVIHDAMEGLEFCAPEEGTNRQSVQMADLNGDDQTEYIVYARNPGNQRLHLLIFSGCEGDYSLLTSMECSGTAFDRVEYVQMDNAVGCEIIVGRSFVDGAECSVSVYTLIINRLESLLDTGYAYYLPTDTDQNDRGELFVLRSDGIDSVAAVMYAMDGRTMRCSDTVPISDSMETVRKVHVGVLRDATPAVFVTGSVADSGGMVTDVFVGHINSLTNVTYDADIGSSALTHRSYGIYETDIDGDGIVEIPKLQDYSGSADSSGYGKQYLIAWYDLDSEGTPCSKLYTYHNYTGGWYLVLDPELAGRYSVVQKGSSYELYLWNEQLSQSDRLLTLYAFTGQRREEQALSNNRFVLLRTDTTVYAANLEIASSAYGITKQDLIRNFCLISDEVLTGV